MRASSTRTAAAVRPVATVRQLVADLDCGAARCEAVTAAALAAARRACAVFIRIHDDALDQAVRIDRARAAGAAVPALAGVPLSLKDLFDAQGERTLAGSAVLRDEAKAATADAVVVGHLRAAGALFIGRANMSEFAFSGMGLNPHYGTPKCIWRREVGHLPGGSSSGGAVGVAEGIVPATVGSDTAGSCRVPAAFNGIVGVKPTFGRVSLRGVYPLSPTSDAPGPLANDLDGCFLLDHVMMGRLRHGAPLPTLTPRADDAFRLLAPRAMVMDDLDAPVEAAFARALEWLREDGIAIARAPLPALDRCVEMFASRAVATFEAWQAHRERLRARGDEYDPYVRRRIESGAQVDAAERAARYRDKAALAAEFARQVAAAGVDALVYPTVQCAPPTLAEADDLDRLGAINFQCLRNTATANYFDGCALSLPCHLHDEPPVGLMLAAVGGQDQALYEIAAAVERSLNRRRCAQAA